MWLAAEIRWWQIKIIDISELTLIWAVRSSKGESTVKIYCHIHSKSHYTFFSFSFFKWSFKFSLDTIVKQYCHKQWVS